MSDSNKKNMCPMGLGQLGNTNLKFPRAFRFILQSKMQPMLEHYLHLADVNLTKKP